ncbi:GDP-mannose 4,6-dehydratase [Beggiatoa leptomitoformis]|uniref:NAD-dependent epimerase/dehydratase family protein n=1 Tax=Beggiatoa leptomitoformis TaxID=288004 RepID=A0A2N9YEU0_9GAMM|nr:GDP-mannose 4,6-dehydratase [Beggiatoa leptomitoformis]ALG68710.1 NAD-dependent epimerase/dehydratase family protein [Beggiatoa leptomitoformis]AUI68935.1 NAD-dependent epimerase/dehydratase family protein [Beggiatoa leptomitoformis]
MKTMLITGGAGFIGVNAAFIFAQKGWKVTILDNLSRKGTPNNLAWLKQQVAIDFKQVDVRDYPALVSVFQQQSYDVVLHLAAQVAVTTSVTNPREDFEINALGTFNVLEAVRQHAPNAFVLYASTNKVFGKMEHLGTVERNGRYEYANLPHGVDETQLLDFHSPYGCSKGAADQYMIDYSRIYGIKTTVFRQSCIYGQRQFGVEDQGWVAWFIIASVLNKPITIYGDGKQIRDVLHVDDLVSAYESAINAPDKACGQAFNVGGGVNNTMSLLELIALLEQGLGKKIPLTFDAWRPGDQPVFVCNLNKIQTTLGWTPQISTTQGVNKLIQWVRDNVNLFE